MRNIIWQLQDLKQYICDLFNPKQKWLTKQIPRAWQDKPELIRDVLFNCIVHFVEEENGLDPHGVDWSEELKNGHVTQEYVDHNNEILDSITRCYNWIKTDRPRLEKIFNENSGGTARAVAAANALERGDSATCRRIVHIYEYLWT
jgi:hypothetical protein